MGQVMGKAVNLALYGMICGFASGYYFTKRIVSSFSKSEDAPRDISGQPISLKKKVVVITGCDTGFGRLLSQQLSCGAESSNTNTNTNMNMYVVALCLTSEAAQELTNLNDSICGIQCDVTKDEDIQRVTVRIETILEEEKAYLHTLVNNAGIANPGNFLFYKNTKPLEQVMSVNYFGMIKVTKSLLPLFLRTSPTFGGRILNMSSVCGASAPPGNSAYNASKFAVEAFSDSIRMELKEQPFNISVVKVRPGQFSTTIQSDWSHGFKKNFETASSPIQELYGGEAFAANMEKTFVSSSGADGGPPGGQPQYVVDFLKSLICEKDLNQLEPYYWLGNDANTLWKALHHLPTQIGDSIKAFFHVAPILIMSLPLLPPTNVVSHVTISVKNIEKSLSFYKAFGLMPVGDTVNGQRFLLCNSSKRTKSPDWSTLVLLKEDSDMPSPRGESYEAGMTRLCIYTSSMEDDVQRLKSQHEMTPIAPTTHDEKAGGVITAFKDPDGFVVYLIQFNGLLGKMVNANLWRKKRSTPWLFHWTINISQDIQGVMLAFEKMGFQTLSDQDSDQVANDLLPAFNMDPHTTKIEHIRTCNRKNDMFHATLMQWIAPKSEKKGWEKSNAMTIAVDDVYAALDVAKNAGLETTGVEYRVLPIYGNVLFGTAYVEPGSAPIEFCCFRQKHIY